MTTAEQSAKNLVCMKQQEILQLVNRDAFSGRAFSIFCTLFLYPIGSPKEPFEIHRQRVKRKKHLEKRVSSFGGCSVLATTNGCWLDL